MNPDALPVTRRGVTRWESPVVVPRKRPETVATWAERSDRAERLAIITELRHLDEQRVRGLEMLARLSR